jgi:hypothetical protein
MCATPYASRSSSSKAAKKGVGLHLLGAALGMYSPISFGMPGIWIGVALWLIVGYPYLVSRLVRAAWDGHRVRPSRRKWHFFVPTWSPVPLLSLPMAGRTRLAGCSNMRGRHWMLVARSLVQ